MLVVRREKIRKAITQRNVTIVSSEGKAEGLSRDRSLSGVQEQIALTISSVWMRMTSPGCITIAGRDDGDCIPFLRSPAHIGEQMCLRKQILKELLRLWQGCRHPHECGRIRTVIFLIQILNSYQDAETSFAGSCRMKAQGSSPLQSKN